jgi:regulator of protease activity HflC (stomatin/prohibitin superfamily)
MTAVALLKPERRPRTIPIRVWWYCRRHWPTIALVALVTVFLAIALLPFYCITVQAGHVAVKWYRFAGGTDTETVYDEGSHFFAPWNKMSAYDARVQHVNRDFDVLTRDGLMITVNIALRFHLNKAAVGLLHKYVGRAYLETLLIPAVGSYARAVFSQNSTDDTYTKQRTELPAVIKQAIVADLANNFGVTNSRRLPWIFLDDVLIRSMRFPPQVQVAINRKMEEYQLKQEYAYRLERERLESERKAVEAQGIARFQSTVSAGISDAYLRWKGIDATLALAQSANAKVVVIGSGREGLPLILGGVDRPSGEGPAGFAGFAEPATRPAEPPITAPGGANGEGQAYSQERLPNTSPSSSPASAHEASTSAVH